jgi:protein-S-isoprenylcysteine O-methyltransferase Ste14
MKIVVPKVTMPQRFERARVLASRVCIGILAVTAIGTESAWKSSDLIEQTTFGLAMLFVAFACLGRIWCLAYISGRKERELVTVGPYSLCRNPLYLFSFLGAVGVALATNTLTFPFVVTLGFFSLYPATVAAEEGRLTRLYGAKYETYQRVTPRFIPAFSRYQRPNRLEIEIRTFQRGLLDAFWFLVALMSIHIIMELHEAGHLAAFLKLI